MSDILSFIASGRLASDAKATTLSDKQKIVYNFTLVNNLPGNTDKVFYIDCAYWVSIKSNTTESYTKFLNDKLLKGQKVTIISSYIEKRTNTNDEGTKQYENITVTVEKLDVS